MTKFLLMVVFVCSSIFGFQATAEEISSDEMAAYLEGCKHALSQAKPNWDHKDIDMICGDPYLQGKANESADDKARRMRLINQTNEDKERIMSNWVTSKDDLKPCFDGILSVDPGKDLKDVKMLCINPYLTASPNESAEDQTRRKRLIKESQEAMHRVMEKHVIPVKKEGKPKTGVR